MASVRLICHDSALSVVHPMSTISCGTVDSATYRKIIDAS